MEHGKVDYEEKVLVDTWPECSNVGPSLEEIYQAFKKRLSKENLQERTPQDLAETEEG